MKLFGRKNELIKTAVKQAVEYTSREYDLKIQHALSAGFKRGFDAARINRLTASFNSEIFTMDQILRMDLKTLKGRARNLRLNNDYARQFIKLLKINVVGPNGVTLQNQAKDTSGKLDTAANKIIEDNFTEWSKKENASVTGKMNFRNLCNLFMTTFAVDGEVLFRRVKGFNNQFNYAIHPLETDRLDVDLNKMFSNGNEIRMGIEFDKWDKPVKYYLKNKENLNLYQPGTHEVVTSDEIIHAFIYETATQSRGVPPMCSAMISMHNLHAAEEAEIYATRGEASKMGFYTRPEDVDSKYDAEKDETGNLVQTAEPAVFEILPPGWNFQAYDPTHPNGNFATFKKECLRSMAAGLGPAYHSLASDLEGVNYSSGRIGSLDERDYYRILQSFMIEEFCNIIFTDLLDMSLLNQKIKLPYTKFDKFNKPVFYARSWDWVDPSKDSDAAQTAIKSRLKSRTEIAAERGKDIRDIFEQIASEEKLAKEMGISLEVIDSKLNQNKEDPNAGKNSE